MEDDEKELAGPPYFGRSSRQWYHGVSGKIEISGGELPSKQDSIGVLQCLLSPLGVRERLYLQQCSVLQIFTIEAPYTNFDCVLTNETNKPGTIYYAVDLRARTALSNT